MAAEINAQLESGAPSLLGFEPVTIAELRQRWIETHARPLPLAVLAVTQVPDLAALVGQHAADAERGWLLG